MRAPISGTMALLTMVVGLVALARGDLVVGLLFSIWANVIALGRGTYQIKVVPVEVQAAVSIARFAADQVNGQRDYVLSREEAAAIRLVCNEAERG